MPTDPQTAVPLLRDPWTAWAVFGVLLIQLLQQVYNRWAAAADAKAAKDAITLAATEAREEAAAQKKRQDRDAYQAKEDAKKAQEAADHAAKQAWQAAEEARKVKEALAAATMAQASAVADVKEALDNTITTTNNKLDGISKLGQATHTLGQATHTLVNNQMHLALFANAKLARQLADMTKGTALGPAAQAAYEEAAGLLKAHDAKQSVVDEASNKAKRDP